MYGLWGFFHSWRAVNAQAFSFSSNLTLATGRRTDKKWCIRAHTAIPHVGFMIDNKIGLRLTQNLRDVPLIIVGGVRHGFFTYFFSLGKEALAFFFLGNKVLPFLFLLVSSASFFFSILPDPLPPAMINGSSLILSKGQHHCLVISSQDQRKVECENQSPCCKGAVKHKIREVYSTMPSNHKVSTGRLVSILSFIKKTQSQWKQSSWSPFPQVGSLSWYTQESSQ